MIYHDPPDEILILDPTATDATLATHYKNGDGQNKSINDRDNDSASSDSMPSSVNIEPQNGAKAIATRIEPITDHTKDEYDKDTDTDLSNSIDNSDKSWRYFLIHDPTVNRTSFQVLY